MESGRTIYPVRFPDILRAISRRKFGSLRSGFWPMIVVLATISFTASGCWYAAIQYAPVALSAAAQLGSGAVHATAGLLGVTHGSFAPDDTRPGENELDRADRCRRLAVIAPGVVELRHRTDGVTEYRGLELGSASDEIHWKPIVEFDTDASGWRPATHYLKMNFTPPLTQTLNTVDLFYLAYAPAESKSMAETDRLAALINNFGGALGSFNSDGRLYAYSVTRKLPCFPEPES